METEDGFIVGVYNYCDRWCEYCPFTGRCHVFADGQEIDFAVASGQSVHEALATQRARLIASLPAMAKELDCGELLETPVSADPAEPSPAQQAIDRCAADYGLRVWEWLKGRRRGPDIRTAAPSPVDVVEHFAIFIGAKAHRAIFGLSFFESDGFDDACGSTKAALLGIERSHAAWLELVAGGELSDAEAAPFIATLVRLADALEREVPSARAFVRPGFDEPDAVARLEASER